jgi:two-component system chemotaxis response regulator CheB
VREFAIIVVGTSQGGLPGLRELVMGLPKDIPAAVFVVQHIGPRRSQLPWILAKDTALPVMHAGDGDPIEAGRIYVAPPDHHLLLERDRARLSRGPRQHWTRPAIDPLFCSAAEFFGPRVIGVLLSGRLNDGTVGLYEIKQQGGAAIVQDPKEAPVADMPLSALRQVEVDYVLPAKRISPTLVMLAREMTAPQARLAQASEGS